MARQGKKMTKSFPVFDCDAHVNDPLEIWSTYVPEGKKEFLRSSGYWSDENSGFLNGRMEVFNGIRQANAGPLRVTMNAVTSAGPGMTKQLQRRLRQMRLTHEQLEYLDNKGMYDAKVRLRDLDVMGIDQVLVIPSLLIQHLPFVENAEAAKLLAEAYNNWVTDWCSESPERLYAAGVLPLQRPTYTVQELHRLAKKGVRVALIRPIDANGNYPNRMGQVQTGQGGGGGMERVFRTFEETGIVVGMHGLTPSHPHLERVWSPGEYYVKANQHAPGRSLAGQPTSFWYECMTWTAQVLLSGLLDQFPKLKMAMFECNASWAVQLVEACDRFFDAYKNERLLPAKRRPSEAFYDQCAIGFEGDEKDVFRQWDRYENIGVWASDCYHQDGLDAWSALEEMHALEVPEKVQAKLMGSTAARLYGIEQKMFVKEAIGWKHPDWFPKEEEVEAWWDKEKYPRKYGVKQVSGTGGY